jgi:hypothetical protein
MPLTRDQAQDGTAVLAEVNSTSGGPIPGHARHFSAWYQNTFTPPTDEWLNTLRKPRGGGELTVNVEIKVDPDWHSDIQDLFDVHLVGYEVLSVNPDGSPNKAIWTCGQVLEDP